MAIREVWNIATYLENISKTIYPRKAAHMTGHVTSSTTTCVFVGYQSDEVKCYYKLKYLYHVPNKYSMITSIHLLKCRLHLHFSFSIQNEYFTVQNMVENADETTQESFPAYHTNLHTNLGKNQEAYPVHEKRRDVIRLQLLCKAE